MEKLNTASKFKHIENSKIFFSNLIPSSRHPKTLKKLFISSTNLKTGLMTFLRKSKEIKTYRKKYKNKGKKG